MPAKRSKLTSEAGDFDAWFILPGCELPARLLDRFAGAVFRHLDESVKWAAPRTGAARTQYGATKQRRYMGETPISAEAAASCFASFSLRSNPPLSSTLHRALLDRRS